MIDAFRESGYEVSAVMGSVRERKAAIRNIKKNISKGLVYDFCYSESSTGPTILSNGWKEALQSGIVDIGFLRFLKSRHIPIGLFYRDIYWKFRVLPFFDLRNRLINSLHYSDLNLYNKTAAKLYLPSRRMGSWLPEISIPMEPLYPGCEPVQSEKTIKDKTHPIQLVYVGGLGGHQYNLEAAINVLKKMPEINLDISTRPSDWKEYSDKNGSELTGNIKLGFLEGESLRTLYQKADIGLLFLEPTEYFSFTMSFKLFEYLGNGIPVIAVQDTATGDFIAKTGAGWTIPHSAEALRELLKNLNDHREAISEKQKLAVETSKGETWKNRAAQVIDSLTGRSELSDIPPDRQ
jgi:glycosyltransferase involved in cell wall biosynthesis